MVCGVALCASAAADVPNSNVSASVPRMIEVPEIPTNAPYPEKPERHTTGWRPATSRTTHATECNRARLSRERRARRDEDYIAGSGVFGDAVELGRHLVEHVRPPDRDRRHRFAVIAHTDAERGGGAALATPWKRIAGVGDDHR